MSRGDMLVARREGNDTNQRAGVVVNLQLVSRCRAARQHAIGLDLVGDTRACLSASAAEENSSPSRSGVSLPADRK